MTTTDYVNDKFIPGHINQGRLIARGWTPLSVGKLLKQHELREESGEVSPLTHRGVDPRCFYPLAAVEAAELTEEFRSMNKAAIAAWRKRYPNASAPNPPCRECGGAPGRFPGRLCEDCF